MDLEQLLGGGMSMPAPGQDVPVMDTAETVQISSLALIKMLKHGRAGVPMEVMGLMLGEFVDDYTVRVVDVFAMPQSGTGVSVEAVDPVFQTKMLDMLKQTGRYGVVLLKITGSDGGIGSEMVVGWYHSHPGFGPWLSSVDINTQMSFEALNKRAVAVVIDPIQSVKGKVVIDAFRLISSQSMMLQQEPRQTTSNLGHLHKPSIVALIHGLNRHYYSMPIDYRKGQLERNMLASVNSQVWSGVTTSTGSSSSSSSSALRELSTQAVNNEAAARSIVTLAEAYGKSLQEELRLTSEELKNRHVGKQDPKRHLKDKVEANIGANVVQILSTMMNREVF